MCVAEWIVQCICVCARVCVCVCVCMCVCMWQGEEKRVKGLFRL